MSASEFLNSQGISMEQALAFVLGNIHNPKTIYDVASQFGVTSAMLAEIVKPAIPEASAEIVEAFFDSHNLDGSVLAENGATPIQGPIAADEETPVFEKLVVFNKNTGALSNEALRSAVIQKTGAAAYNSAFSPKMYDFDSDGIVTGYELGTFSFPDFRATQANLESVHYGTLINVLGAIDASEMQQINDFYSLNMEALASGNTSVMEQYLYLMVAVFEDKAQNAIIQDQEFVNAVISSTVNMVEIVGTGGAYSAFDDIMMELAAGQMFM